MAQSFVSKALSKKDIAVDATLGNGNDTLFLSERVGKEGEVYSFEIQKEAIDKFNELLVEKNISNVKVIHSGHENMDKYLIKKPKAIMFNLGYLPGGSKNIKTKPQTTIIAVKKGLEMLKPGGIMTIIAYIGHEGGQHETDVIVDYLKTLSPKEFSIINISYFSTNNNAPILICIEKNCNLNEGK